MEKRIPPPKPPRKSRSDSVNSLIEEPSDVRKELPEVSLRVKSQYISEISGDLDRKLSPVQYGKIAVRRSARPLSSIPSFDYPGNCAAVEHFGVNPSSSSDLLKVSFNYKSVLNEIQRADTFKKIRNPSEVDASYTDKSPLQSPDELLVTPTSADSIELQNKSAVQSPTKENSFPIQSFFKKNFRNRNVSGPAHRASAMLVEDESMVLLEDKPLLAGLEKSLSFAHIFPLGIHTHDNTDQHSALPDTALNESSSHHLTSVLKPCKEDYLTWSLFTREGKKLRKNWSNSFISYCPKSSPKGNCGALWFSKSSEEPKKCLFEMVPPCIVDGNVLKRSTKPNVICIQNGAATELLLQLKDPDELADWMKAFITNDNALERDFTPDKEKKAKRGDKALTKKDSEEFGSPNDKGIQSFFKSYLKRRPSRDVLVKKGIYKEAVFGSTIAELCSKEGPFIPLFVLKCFQNIEKNRDNFKVDGLYRICGNASRIQKIRFEVAQNRYSILEEEKDVHNLTGALKLFFRELKEPVVPFVCYHTFIRASENSRLRGRSEALQEALKLLPRCNHDTLKLLLEHLLKVNMCEQDNRMSIMNLAVVFGPCLLWPEDTIGLDLMTDVMLQNRVIEALLSDYSKIYKDSKLVLP